MPQTQTNGATPPLKIEYVPINKVLRYAQNTRDHSDAQVELIMTSMREVGFSNPCLVDAKGVLIAGHARTEAASRLGFKKVPIIRLGHLTETQARALRIKDNSLALLSTWNEDMLRLELPDLKLDDYPLESLGFEDIKLVQFMTMPTQPTAPGEFGAVGEDIDTEHSCPKCGYRWSGQSDAAGPAKK